MSITEVAAQAPNIFSSDIEASILGNYSKGVYNPLQLFLGSDESLTLDELKDFQTKYKDLLQSLRAKKSKNERQFLRRVFYQTKSTFLIKYKKMVNMSSVFRNNEYDCVTGTALYANLLKDLGYEYEIIEMEFHVFLIAHVGKKKYLFESTDDNGIVSNPKMIRRLLKKYNEGETSSEDVKLMAAQTNERGVFRKVIDLAKLGGLQYYNLAVKAYLAKNDRLAWEQLQKANLIYPCNRVTTMINLLNI